MFQLRPGDGKYIVVEAALAAVGGGFAGYLWKGEKGAGIGAAILAGVSLVSNLIIYPLVDHDPFHKYRNGPGSVTIPGPPVSTVTDQRLFRMNGDLPIYQVAPAVDSRAGSSSENPSSGSSRYRLRTGYSGESGSDPGSGSDTALRSLR